MENLKKEKNQDGNEYWDKSEGIYQMRETCVINQRNVIEKRPVSADENKT